MMARRPLPLLAVALLVPLTAFAQDAPPAAPAPPAEAQPAPLTKLGGIELMFTSVERTRIRSVVEHHVDPVVNEPSAPTQAPAPVKQAAAPVYVGGVISVGHGRWTAWVNDHPVSSDHPQADTPASVSGVEGTTVLLGGEQPAKLAPNQTLTRGGKEVIPGDHRQQSPQPGSPATP